MRVLRPVLVGLVAGAAVAFVVALVGPRRRAPLDLDTPAPDLPVDLRAPSASRSVPGAL